MTKRYDQTMSSPATQRAMVQATELLQAGHYPRACEVLTAALRRDPREPALHYLLGKALVASGDGTRAIFHLETARAVMGADSRVLMQLGIAHQHGGERARSIRYLEEAVVADPSSDICAVNLASALYADGQLTRALAAAQRALQLNPQRVQAAIMCGLIDTHRGDCDRGLATLLEATSSHPTHQELWKLVVTTGNYAAGVSGESMRALIERYIEVCGPVVSRPAATLMRRPDAQRRLTIAYLSQDLRNRSVGHFVQALFEHHDAEQYEVHALSMCREPDELSARLSARCAGWHEVCGWSADAIVDLVDRIGVDIMIDLAGHTCDETREPLARRLAPVQMTYCGYPNTTGIASMDYRIVDELTDPPGSESHASERLVRLPRCFLCYAPPSHATEVSRSAKSAQESLVFGTFNTMFKISDQVLSAWGRILQAVPDSTLLIKNQDLANPDTVAYVRERAGRFGIAASRLDLRGQTRTLREHMCTYSEVDIGLDTFPYNGTTTTAEALVSGVPVVAVTGDRHVSRVGCSLLTASGLSSLVAADVDEYVSIAIGLASERERLNELHASVREMFLGSPACDQVRFVRDFELMLRQVWQQACTTLVSA